MAWLNSCQRFVAYLDVMGFRDRVYRESHSSVGAMMDILYTSTLPIMQEADIALRKSSDQKTQQLQDIAVRPVLFSDSVLLVTEDNSWGSFGKVLFAVAWMLQAALAHGIPLKGAIAFGEQTADFDRSLHYGRPLVDAYELANQAEFYGVVLHHSAESLLIHNLQQAARLNSQVMPAKVPMKAGSIQHSIVRLPGGYLTSAPIALLVLGLYSTVSGQPRKYVDNTRDILQLQLSLYQSELSRNTQAS